MIARLIEFCANRRGLVFVCTALAVVGSVLAIENISLDAIPDLSDPQVIVFTEWMGRSPDLVEDQVTYPIVSALLAAPKVRTVRGQSMFGMSFIYVIFEEGTDPYWARSRVLEYMDQIRGRLPDGVTPTLGPDASAVGWAYQYALVDKSGRHDLADLRAYQDFNLRYALASVPGVAEVASVGGFERQYQVEVDPAKLHAYGYSLADVSSAIRRSNSDVGGRVIEMSGREYFVRGRGYVRTLDDLRQVALGVDSESGTPIRIADLGNVSFGPDIRRGAADLDGEGEVVGGTVVVRYGENVLDVISRVKKRLEELEPSMPEGVEVKVVYDRTDLIHRAIETLRHTLLEEMLVVSLVIFIFLLHLRSTLVPVISLPVSVGLAFIPMYFLGINSNIMSLGGIAIAIGALVDAAIVLVENGHKHLEALPDDAPEPVRRRALIDAAKEVGPPIFFSLLIITVSFLPIFALEGQAGRLFKPLAWTKTFAMGFAAIVSVTLAPALVVLFVRGKIKHEREHPVSKFLVRMYEPMAMTAIRNPRLTALVAVLAILSAVPMGLRLGSEFMPPLNEGDLLYMPTTFPNVSIEEAKRSLQIQDRVLMEFPEVETVFGKVGRSETATDPAPLSMVETVAKLKPRSEWRNIRVERWYSPWAPEWMKPVFGLVWPEKRRITWDELTGEMNERLQMPGWTNAWTMPIKTRIDMLSTGIRTPIGIKVFGADLDTIQRIGLDIERALSSMPETRSAYSDRATGGFYLDIVPDRVALARYGLKLGDVQDVVEAAVGGQPIEVTVQGRERFTINVRYPRELRQDLEQLRHVLVPLHSGGMPAAAMDPGAMQFGKAGGPHVPLEQVADLEIVPGPPMIRDEDGLLTSYVFVDIDQSKQDVGSYVDHAKQAVAANVTLPAGYFLRWTGQYELLEAMQKKMRLLIPLTLLLVIFLLFMHFRRVVQPLIVLCSVPFALVGSIWLMAWLDYNLSTAVWVGVIALLGLAAETGVVMITYMDSAYLKRKAAGLMNTFDDVVSATMEGAVQRVRPKVMTVATTMIGLTPLLWSQGAGADVMKRVAAPMVGGMLTSAFLTLVVIPMVYAHWRNWELNREQRRHAANAS